MFRFRRRFVVGLSRSFCFGTTLIVLQGCSCSSPGAADYSAANNTDDTTGPGGTNTPAASNGTRPDDMSRATRPDVDTSHDDVPEDGGHASNTDATHGLGQSSGATGSATSNVEGGVETEPDPPSGETIPDPLPRSYRSALYVFPEPKDSVECAERDNDTATIERVYFAQTHALEPSYPFFYLTADRPALVEVVVTGDGQAPDVRVSGTITEPGTTTVRDLGTLCLAGPETLAASVDVSQHSKADRFTATLPAAWLRVGLGITVTAGKSSETFTSEQLGVAPTPDVNLIMLPMDVLNYNEGQADQLPPASWLGDFASATPAAHVRFGTIPGRAVLPKIATSHRTDNAAGEPPIVLDRRLCDGDEPSGDTCVDSDVEPMELLGTTINIIEAIHQANGDFAATFYYGNSEGFFPGGWGGGKNFVGADFGDVFIHEQGHAFSLQHWGQGYFQGEESFFLYPYGGETEDGGGRGESWNYYQNTGEFVSPICLDEGENLGKERSDAMQRNHPCIEWRTNGPGPWDGYGDYSLFGILRNLRGGPDLVGEVPYKGENRPFHFGETSGYPNLVINDAGERSLERVSGTPTDEESLDFLFAQEWDVPVATIFGSFHPSFSEANILYAPIQFSGSLPKIIDPTDPATFTALREDPYRDYFYWTKDLTVKVTYADGSEQIALVTQHGPPRDWILDSGPWRRDITYFAVNVRGEEQVTRVELYRRPFVVRYEDDTTEGNIANDSLGITPSNFMDDAVLITTWEL